MVESDEELVQIADYVFSIVPPRDAWITAKRFAPSIGHIKDRRLIYVDLNAISPSSAARIGGLFFSSPIPLIDGGIIGGPPKPQPDATWSKPSIVTSGPHQIDDNLAKVLNVTHIADNIGPASGLKMCFASMTKGLTAIAIQSFTTAHSLGVLDQLQSHLTKYSPMTGQLASKGLVSMPPKAYRWVDEMNEIAATFERGGFDKDLFKAVGEIYEFVAETELGKETTEDRKFGKTPEDVARLVAEGLESRRAEKVVED